MNIQPIHNEDDRTAAFEELQRLQSALQPNPSKDGSLETLASVVRSFEEKYWPIDELKISRTNSKAPRRLTDRAQQNTADTRGSRSDNFAENPLIRTIAIVVAVILVCVAILAVVAFETP